MRPYEQRHNNIKNSINYLRENLDKEVFISIMSQKKLNYHYFTSDASLLLDGFEWVDSKEGYAYWFKTYKYLSLIDDVK